MKTKVLVCIFVVLSNMYNVFGQEWIRIYGDSIDTYVKKVEEQYDKGFLFSGARYENAYYARGWIMKTDVNGYSLWQKRFDIPNKFVQFFGATACDDGGVAEIGVTNKLSTSCYDPIIIKTNSCFEKEWCRIYNSPNCTCDGLDIQCTPDGGYMALIARWENGEEKTIWLFRLDSIGDVIWAQVFATVPEWNSEWPHSLLKTSDSCFIITGQAYYPDPTYPNKKIIKIILIKVTLDGETIFEVPWGVSNGVYSDGRLSVVDIRNNIFTAGRRARTIAPYGDSPTLFRTTKTGQPVSYKDLKTTSSLGIASTVNWFQDSTLVQCAGWVSGGNDTTALIKTDSLGNSIKEKPLLVNYNSGSFYASTITFNDRILLAGNVYSGGGTHTYAFKLNSDLEYDSIYTTPFTYDSLCPHPIVSDTISLDDCEVVVVGVDDPVKFPEKTRLHAYPNPAKNIVTIGMPEYLVRNSRNQASTGIGISATTYYHQWSSVRLDVFDLFGKLMYSKDIPGKTEIVELDVSSWPNGMYLARIVFMNEVAGTVKFVKE